MGLTNATFLIGLIDLYDYLSKKNKVHNGELFYEAKIFTESWDISLHQQNKAIEVLTSIRLLKVIGRGYRNTRIIKIQKNKCTCIFQLIIDLDKEDVDLRYFFLKLQEKCKIRSLVVRWLKKNADHIDDLPLSENYQYAELVEKLVDYLI